MSKRNCGSIEELLQASGSPKLPRNVSTSRVLDAPPYPGRDQEQRQCNEVLQLVIHIQCTCTFDDDLICRLTEFLNVDLE